MTIATIVKKIQQYPLANHITITGGEPLIQHGTIALLDILCTHNYPLQLETNGSISLEKVPQPIHRIVDVKTPSSGEEKSFNFTNLQLLQPYDEIKFVIANEVDYNYAKEFIQKYCATICCVINFSPVALTMKPQTLAEYILRDRLPVRLNVQLHKMLWQQEPKDF